MSDQTQRSQTAKRPIVRHTVIKIRANVIYRKTPVPDICPYPDNFLHRKKQ